MLLVAKEECSSFCATASARQTTLSHRYERLITTTKTDDHFNSASEPQMTHQSFHITIHVLPKSALVGYEICKANRTRHYST